MASRDSQWTGRRRRTPPFAIGIALTVAAIAALAPRGVRAAPCECGKLLSTAEALSRAEAVFVGRVVDIWPARVQGYHQILLGRRITFGVTARFKGDSSVDQLVILGACDYGFERGASYLVFAQRDFTGGNLTAPTCFPSANLDSGPLCPEERRALGVPFAGALDAPSPPAPADSRVHRWARRVAVIALLAEIKVRDLWHRWTESDRGAETQFALALVLSTALGGIAVLVRRRRYALGAGLGLGAPGFLALLFLAWMTWSAFSTPWVADLMR